MSKTKSTLELAVLTPSTQNEPINQSLDKRLVGEMNRQAILSWLYRFGWLTSRMVARLVWKDASQAWPMARRTLSSMQDEGTVIKRALPQGGEAYLLAAKGARYLNERHGLNASSGQCMTIGNTLHRACSNWYLIEALSDGWGVITEHEIASDRCQVRVFDGKQADGLLLGDGEAIWVECENAWKAVKARKEIVDFCGRHLDRDQATMVTPDYSLRQVTVVSTNMDALRNLASSFQQAYRLGTLREAQLQMVNVSLLPVSQSLVAGEKMDGNLWADVMLPAM